jgi:hypothetical protein
MSSELDAVPAPEPALPADVPQFATAEYAHIPGTERCRICGSLIAGEYYRVNNQMACSTCASQAKDGQPTDSHAAFVRALLFGLGAAIGGMILYALITMTLSFTIGYFALGVGWMVGTAMKKGSHGIGGRRYQVVAVLLTYLAISSAAVPPIIFAINKEVAKKNAQFDADAAQAKANGAAEVPANHVQMNWGKVAGRLGEYAVASPFMDLREGTGGVIGLVILFVGLSIGFRMVAPKPLEVDGPYSATAG